MSEITMSDFDAIIKGVTLEKVCQVSPDSEAKQAGINKQVTVKVSFDGITLRQVFDGAMRPTVIKWQSGTGRKSFDTLAKVVNIHYASAGAKDPIAASVDWYKRATPAQREDYRKRLEAMEIDENDE